MKFYVRSMLMLCSLLWLPINAFSEESASSAEQPPAISDEGISQAKIYDAIQQLKMNIRRANVVFYRLMNDATNTQLYKQIPPQVKVIEQQWTSLKQQLNSDSQPINKTDAHWKLYQQRIATNREDIYRDGYPVNQLVNDMLENKKRLINDLNTIAANLNYTPTEFLSTSYKQSQLMLDIAELYGELSVSIVGNPLVTDEMTLDQFCELFNTTLGTLKTASREVPESKALIRTITSKWKFIEKSVRNHQENMVPYLVARYSDAILDKLNLMNELYLQKQ